MKSQVPLTAVGEPQGPAPTETVPQSVPVKSIKRPDDIKFQIAGRVILVLLDNGRRERLT